MNEESKKEKLDLPIGFEGKKIISLNKFFMKNVVVGLLFSLLLFILTVCLLVFILIISDIDMTVKITIISMVATFVLTSSKTMLDRVIDVVTYAVKLLGEEQRALNKKIGIEVEDVEFGSISDDEKKD